MSIEVTSDVFDFFKSRIGGWVGEEEELADLHEWSSSDLEYLDVVEIPFDWGTWSDDLLEDWDKLNIWLDSFFIEDYECETPKEYFNDRDSVIRYVVAEIVNNEKYDELVGCVELTSKGNSIFLIYTELNTSWWFSDHNSVFVAETLDDLTEKYGFVEQSK